MSVYTRQYDFYKQKRLWFSFKLASLH